MKEDEIKKKLLQIKNACDFIDNTISEINDGRDNETFPNDFDETTSKVAHVLMDYYEILEHKSSELLGELEKVLEETLPCMPIELTEKKIEYIIEKLKKHESYELEVILNEA